MLPHDVFRYLRAALPLTAVLLVLGLAAGTAIAFLTPPRYQATAHDYVGTTSTSSVSDLVTVVSVAQQIVQSYATVSTDPLVLQPVIDKLGLHTTAAELAQDVTVTNEPGTLVLDVTATAAKPQTAADIANGVSGRLASVVDQLTPPKGNAKGPIKVTQTLVAQAPASPISPQRPLDIALGGVVGIAVGLLLGLLRFLLDKRIRTIDDLARTTDAPVLASVPWMRGAKRGVVDNPAAVSEAYRLLRTNLQFLDVGRGSSALLITSSIPGEGKTSTAGNLAVAIAEAQRPVVLVDADLRRPAVHTLFGIDNAVGLTDVLIGAVSLDDALQSWNSGKLMILPSGRTPPNPGELLQSKEMVDVLATLRKRFGTVLIDAAPLNPVADSVALAACTDGSLVVVGPSTTEPQLQRALLRLGTVKGRVLGLVTNLKSRRGRNDLDQYGEYAPVQPKGKAAKSRSSRESRGRPRPASEA